ncbi:MAG: citrate/2-methylcitrate synthase [Actinomycetota bacterium]|nr:citrate synthase [Actinomycetota bacterium]
MPGRGLEDVVAAQTAISDIDGRLGRLFYVGYDIHELAENSTFEETVWLLHHLKLPTQDELDQIADQLGVERDLDDFVLRLMPTMAEQTSPMSMLRTTVSAMSAHDPDGWDQSPDANYRKAMRLVARFPTVIAMYDRIRKNLDVIKPNPKLSHAGNLLYMLLGHEPEEEMARVLDICLILHADHTMNASTFAARVAASTLSDIHSAITAAIATLKGPLHGGANEAVMNMLLKIDDPGKVEAHVKKLFAEKKKIMGFGHRVYKTEDPRATVLRKLAKQVGEHVGETKWYEMSLTVEEVVKAEKGLYPNVDFFAASVYYGLGIPVDLFTPIFAASRVSGWTAHVREQYDDNRLIRPESDYIGPRNQHYISIDQRG